MTNLEQVLGVPVGNTKLFETAFTHSSFANKAGVESNQRLEYLGDSILDFTIGEYLYLNHGDYDEGKLTRIRANIVSERPLAEASERVGLPGMLKYSFDTDIPQSVKSDLFEAVVGAIYLDSGMENAKKFILRALENAVSDSLKMRDYKTAALEWGAKHGKKVSYALVDSEGPSHKPVFVCAILVDGEERARASGSSKKRAEQYAAEAFCKKFVC